jgi:hypothetical protein
MTKTIARPSPLRALSAAFLLGRVAFRWGARLGVVAAAGFGVRQVLARRDSGAEGGPRPEWPPMESAKAQGLLATPSPAAEPAAGGPTAGGQAGSSVTGPADPPAETPQGEAGAAARWIEPVEGNCPASHPIKANADSGIYHVPAGSSYKQTRAERCYCTEADAEADGFRRAKR